jgi:chromosome segregation ATPase
VPSKAPRAVDVIEAELADARSELADAERRLDSAQQDVFDCENEIADLEDELRAAGVATLPKGMDIAQYEKLLTQPATRFAALDTLRVLARADKRFTAKLAEVERLRMQERTNA